MFFTLYMDHDEDNKVQALAMKNVLINLMLGQLFGLNNTGCYDETQEIN